MYVCVFFSPPDISYHMTIKTGDKPNAGTDANVYFALHGDKGETPRIGLQDESKTFRRFERARADKFVVQTADVGKVYHAVIITKPPFCGSLCPKVNLLIISNFSDAETPLIRTLSCVPVMTFFKVFTFIGKKECTI